MPSRVIENYEPDDRGWGIVIGRSMQKPEPKPEPEEQQAKTPKSAMSSA